MRTFDDGMAEELRVERDPLDPASILPFTCWLVPEEERNEGVEKMYSGSHVHEKGYHGNI